MASYLLHFTKGLVPVPGQMPQLGRDLVRRGLYGIPSTAMLRHRIGPRDLVIVTVGSPHRVFVADAIVESGYHRFDEEERARRPQWNDRPAHPGGAARATPGDSRSTRRSPRAPPGSGP